VAGSSESAERVRTPNVVPVGVGGERLAQIMTFVLEMDGLKDVLRKVHILSGERHENSAEHSWHVALLAVLLAEYAAEPVDLCHVLRMLLVHDIVEIDAGDTFAFADQSNKAASEEAAAARLFGLLPDELGAELAALFREFDGRATPEARFANAMDRIMPALQNCYGGGGTWREHGVSWEQVQARLSPIGDGVPLVWEWMQPLLNESRARGDIRG
jgi:putative hydrolase of HD superfamily